jgi:hypothetical protein
MAKTIPKPQLRKPPAPRAVARPEAIDQFVTGPSSTRSDARTGARADVARKDGRSLRRKTIYFAIPLAKRLELYCTVKECDMSDVVSKAVEEFLSKPQLDV